MNHPTLVSLYVLNSIQIESAHNVTNVFKNMTTVFALYIVFSYSHLKYIFAIFFNDTLHNNWFDTRISFLTKST